MTGIFNSVKKKEEEEKQEFQKPKKPWKYSVPLAGLAASERVSGRATTAHCWNGARLAFPLLCFEWIQRRSIGMCRKNPFHPNTASRTAWGLRWMDAHGHRPARNHHLAAFARQRSDIFNRLRTGNSRNTATCCRNVYNTLQSRGC